MTVDPFGTQVLRAAVLDAWVRTPARFREDANTEEDHAAGYYRDRVVVELAQNAADAAARRREPGRLELRLIETPDGVVLLAGNSGEPLDAAGVASLAALRASAKTGADPALVGRFGVGFAAVRSVADDIWVLSGDSGVRFSLDLTRAALGPEHALAEHVAGRGNSLPVLRLPFPATRSDLDVRPEVAEAIAAILDRCTTVVVLSMRDDEATAAVRAQLDEVDDALLLALDALEDMTVDIPGVATRTLRDVSNRWVTVRRSGEVPTALLATRPVEERGRTTWSVLWAAPKAADLPLASVVRAPTPTDEPLSFPALLIASFPLDPSRRHVADDPFALWIADRAGEAYADLVPLVERPLALVPTGLPRGRLDAVLRDRAVVALRGSAMVAGRIPDDVVMIDGEASDALVVALEPTGLGVVAVPRRFQAAARSLGVEVMTCADVIDALPSGLSPVQWRALYAALDSVADDRRVREALDGILVPLADGSIVRGPRGVLIPTEGAPEIAIDGLRMVHPDAVHPALLRWGAVRVHDPQTLGLAAVERAVQAIGDDLVGHDVDSGMGNAGAEDERRAVDTLQALLRLVSGFLQADGGHRHDLPAWWSRLPLPSDDGFWHEARDLAWPGSWAGDHLDLPLVEPDGVLGALSRECAEVVGVRTGLTVLVVDQDTGAVDGPDVAGWAEYDDYLCDVLGEGVSVGELAVVTDLDVVLDGSWGPTIERLVGEPALRAALLIPVRGGAGPTTVQPRTKALSYAAWYIRDLLGAPFAGPGLGDLLPPIPDELAEIDDDEALRALGVVAHDSDVQDYLAVPDAYAWAGFFSALGAGREPLGAPVPIDVARAVWSALELAALAGLELDPLPEFMIVLRGNVPRIVAAADVAVTAEPMWAQVRSVVPVSGAAEIAVAHALDCPVLDSATVRISTDGEVTTHQVPAAVRALVPGVPDCWFEHVEVVVDGMEVDWWVPADGSVHVRGAAGVAAAGQACAQAAGAWNARFALEIMLGNPSRSVEVVAQAAWS